jgi:DNA integrity scanning protein DisA with diadenylate cyclase activity
MSVHDTLTSISNYIKYLEEENKKIKTQYSELKTEIADDNFNSICDSGLESGQQIFAVGDNHTIYYYKSYDYCYVGWSY